MKIPDGETCLGGDLNQTIWGQPVLEMRDFYRPDSLEGKIRAYLDDKLIEHDISSPNHLVVNPKKGRRRYEHITVTLYQVPPKMLRYVILPEFKRIAREFGRVPLASFTGATVIKDGWVKWSEIAIV